MANLQIFTTLENCCSPQMEDRQRERITIWLFTRKMTQTKCEEKTKAYPALFSISDVPNTVSFPPLSHRYFQVLLTSFLILFIVWQQTEQKEHSRYLQQILPPLKSNHLHCDQDFVHHLVTEKRSNKVQNTYGTIFNCFAVHTNLACGHLTEYCIFSVFDQHPSVEWKKRQTWLFKKYCIRDITDISF